MALFWNCDVAILGFVLSFYSSPHLRLEYPFPGIMIRDVLGVHKRGSGWGDAYNLGVQVTHSAVDAF